MGRYHEMRLNPHERIVVELNVFRNYVLVTVRCWSAEDGDIRPTSTGISLTPAQWKRLLPKLEEAISVSTEDTEDIDSVVAKNASSVVRTQARAKCGDVVIDVRVWKFSGDDYYRTDKGICLSPEHWRELLPAVRQALEDTEQRRIEVEHLLRELRTEKG